MPVTRSPRIPILTAGIIVAGTGGPGAVGVVNPPVETVTGSLT